MIAARFLKQRREIVKAKLRRMIDNLLAGRDI